MIRRIKYCFTVPIPLLRGYWILVLMLLSVTACRKPKDKDGACDQCSDRVYCNDPLAVNYNHGFPGRPDSTVCYYPAYGFEGYYSFEDSVYGADEVLDSANIIRRDLYITSLYKNRVGVTGLCGPDTLRFTSDRHYYAVADTLFEKGQYFCSSADTFTGNMRIRRNADTTLLLIDIRVFSNDSVRYHRGTAVKQL